MPPQGFNQKDLRDALLQLETEQDASLQHVYEEVVLEEAVVVVDPVSTGAMVALLAKRRGYKVVAVFSAGLTTEVLSMIPKPCRDAGLTFDFTVKHTGNLEDTLQRIKKLPNLLIRQVLAGCESGVELYDAVAHALGMRCNGVKLTEARRNKFLQGERVRTAGLRSVKQLLTNKWEEVPAFIKSLGTGPIKMVLKPVDSAGTDGVYFASSVEEARAAFDRILSMVNLFGGHNTTVLVQEYLQGVEYVVDSVSYEGEHKVVAFWRYDKRRVNGTPFAYYGLRLFESADRSIEQRLAEYSHACLDAVGIANGPSHAEVMWLDGEDAPCLIEVGSRPHGGEGTFVGLTAEAIGYNQISVTLDCIKEPQRFRDLPTIPPPLKAHAAEACLVSHGDGRLVGFRRGMEEVRGMESVKSIELMVSVGSRMQRTVDIVTAPGSILLGHRDATVLERDYERIHELEVADLFDVVAEEEGQAAQAKA